MVQLNLPSPGEIGWGDKLNAAINAINNDTSVTDGTDGEAVEYVPDVSNISGPVGPRLTIPTHVSPAGGQVTHPSVLFIPEGWNGYEYWMAITPYPSGNDSYEDPNVVASRDGTHWVVPNGMTEPIDDAPGTPQYNSDVDLRMGPDNTMYLFWRYFDSTNVGAEETLLYATSTNGSTWSQKTIIYQTDQTVRRLASPAFWYENNRWTMWAVDLLPSPNQIVKITSNTSDPSAGWKTPVNCVTGPMRAGKEPWHIEVMKHGGRYVALLNDCTTGVDGGGGGLLFMASPDGVTWASSADTVIPMVQAGEHDQLYRSSFWPAIKDGLMGYRVWYTGWTTASPHVWNLYYTWIGAPVATGGGGGTVGTVDRITNGTNYLAAGSDVTGPRLYADTGLLYGRNYGTASPTATKLVVSTNQGTVGVLNGKLDTNYLPYSAGSVYNVKDYGAKGDGVTDDKAAFQAALDAAYAAGGGTVLVPPSSKAYWIQSVLIIRARTKLSAYGATIRRATPTFSWIRNFDQAADSFSGYTGHSDIVIEGGTWDGGVAPTTQSSGNCVTFAHCERVMVKDMRFVSTAAAAHAVEFNGVRSGKMIRCSAEGMSTATTNSEAFQIDGAFPGIATCMPEDNTTCQDILVDGCSTTQYGSLGYFGRLVGGHSSKLNYYHRQIRVVNCMSFGTIEHGIRPYQWIDSVVANNTIINAGSIGIQARCGVSPDANGIQNLVIANNTVRDSTGDGIQVIGDSSANQTRSVVVQGNAIYSPGGNGIQVSFADFASIVGNTVEAAGATAIATTNSHGVTINGNTVMNSSSHGIGCDTSTSAVVTGNMVDTVGGYGIVISPNSNDATVTGNMVNHASGGAYRFSSGSNNCLISGNQARLGGLATGSGMALSITSTCAGTTYYGNFFQGFTTTGIADSGTSSVSTAVNRT